MNMPIPNKPAAGTIITTANTMPVRWYETTFRINEDGLAQPIKRQHYWGAAEGKTENLESQPPCEMQLKMFPSVGKYKWSICGLAIQIQK